MSSSGNLNMISQIITTGQAIDNMELNNAVVNFAKAKNDSASRSAIKSYHKYWKYSLLLWIVLISVLFVGIFIINKQYEKLNNPGNIKYNEVVTGYVNNKTGMVDYIYMGFKHYPISKATWISNLNLKNKTSINIYLNNNSEPIYMSKFYNKYTALFIFIPLIIILLIIGIISINKLAAKKFADYKNWFIYNVLPISDDPNFESLVEKLEYRKMNFSTKDLNTKESKDLKKANKTQIICGVAFLIEGLLFIFVNTFLLGNYFEHGLNFFAHVILIILILPFVIIGVNADHKARTLKGIVAEQNYRRIYNEGNSNK